MTSSSCLSEIRAAFYSRENLMDLVWGYTYAGDYRTVDVHIRRLREKLETILPPHSIF